MGTVTLAHISPVEWGHRTKHFGMFSNFFFYYYFLICSQIVDMSPCYSFLVQMCIFFIPATGVIPLHNHPGMTVFSKLLLGKMHIKAYDWAEPVNFYGSATSSSQCGWLSLSLSLSIYIYISPHFGMNCVNVFAARLAKLKADRVFTAPCDTSVLYPTTGGNIHAFTAITPCAVLDVLGPPYSKEDGRDCSYYKDYPYTASSKSNSCALLTFSCM